MQLDNAKDFAIKQFLEDRNLIIIVQHSIIVVEGGGGGVGPDQVTAIQVMR